MLLILLTIKTGVGGSSSTNKYGRLKWNFWLRWIKKGRVYLLQS